VYSVLRVAVAAVALRARNSAASTSGLL
jgi:hypothetical protein